VAEGLAELQRGWLNLNQGLYIAMASRANKDKQGASGLESDVSVRLLVTAGCGMEPAPKINFGTPLPNKYFKYVRILLGTE